MTLPPASLDSPHQRTFRSYAPSHIGPGKRRQEAVRSRKVSQSQEICTVQNESIRNAKKCGMSSKEVVVVRHLISAASWLGTTCAADRGKERKHDAKAYRVGRKRKRNREIRLLGIKPQQREKPTHSWPRQEMAIRHQSRETLAHRD